MVALALLSVSASSARAGSRELNDFERKEVFRALAIVAKVDPQFDDDHGKTNVVGDMSRLLNDGKLRVPDRFLKGSPEVETVYGLINTYVHLNPESIWMRVSSPEMWHRMEPTARRELEVRDLISLAASLVHEWVHVRRGKLTTKWMGDNAAEIEAYAFEYDFLVLLKKRYTANSNEDKGVVFALDAAGRQLDDRTGVTELRDSLAANGPGGRR